MRVTVITPPAGPVVSLEEAKAHVNVHFDDDDPLIEAYVAAAIANLDGPSGWLGRALGAQTLEARFDSFSGEPIVLPCPPIAAIASVKYVDLDGVEQTVDPATYELLGDELAPKYGSSWPQVRRQREAVRVRYTAGYTVGDPPAALHPAIRAALLLMVGDLYGNRETVAAVNMIEIPMSASVLNLLTPLRIYA